MLFPLAALPVATANCQPGDDHGLHDQSQWRRPHRRVDGDTPLLWVLRDVFGMTGIKIRLWHGALRRLHSALGRVADPLLHYAVDSIGSAAVTTIEAIEETAAGQKIQKAWLDLEVVRCGYCQSGQKGRLTAQS
jgi:isoquinoline 1-oxidoreductase subunit alpha